MSLSKMWVESEMWKFETENCLQIIQIIIRMFVLFKCFAGISRTYCFTAFMFQGWSHKSNKKIKLIYSVSFFIFLLMAKALCKKRCKAIMRLVWIRKLYVALVKIFHGHKYCWKRMAWKRQMCCFLPTYLYGYFLVFSGLLFTQSNIDVNQSAH